MGKDILASKFFIKDGLISLKGIFDINQIGKIDGLDAAVYCLWFDKDMYIKEIEITVMEAKDGPRDCFFTEGNFTVVNNMLSFGGPAKLMGIGSQEYSDYVSRLEKNLYYVCFWDFGKTAVKPLKVDIDGQRFKIYDFLINPGNFKIEKIIYGNFISKKNMPVRGVVGKNKEDQCFTFSR